MISAEPRLKNQLPAKTPFELHAMRLLTGVETTKTIIPIEIASYHVGGIMVPKSTRKKTHELQLNQLCWIVFQSLCIQFLLHNHQRSIPQSKLRNKV